ncbi:hypothetical protein HZR84_11195 [Hyphobacterium sp. CCMP332]|nr:hypothetical protein HZR84_11195 [Hyphobacterium sp. CCMP332]
MRYFVVTFFLFFAFHQIFAEKHLNHPFYVSIIHVNHNLKTNCLELTFKIFTDDLETGIKYDSGKILNLYHSSNTKKADSIISDYLKSHFRINISDVPSNLNLVGIETAFDVTEVYFTIDSVKPNIDSIEINCDLLVEEIPEQSNIIHYQIRDKTKSLILNKKNTNGIIKI